MEISMYMSWLCLQSKAIHVCVFESTGKGTKAANNFSAKLTYRASAASMPQLQEERRFLAVHCFDYWLPSFNLLLGVDSWYIGIPGKHLDMSALKWHCDGEHLPTNGSQQGQQVVCMTAGR